jgi:hypothetical protein
MKTARALLPLAIGIAAVGGVTWFLLSDGSVIGPWLLALILLGHGCVHLTFVAPVSRSTATTAEGLEYPFDMDRSWLITRLSLDPGAVRLVGIVLAAVVFSVSVMAALATIGFLVPAASWAGLVVAASVSSMVLLALFFSPGLVLGFAIDVALLALALSSAWSPAAA